MYKQLIIVSILYVVSIGIIKELQRVDWNLIVDYKLTEYNEQKKSDRFIQSMEQDILTKSEFSLKDNIYSNLVFLINGVLILLYIRNYGIKSSNLKIVILISILLSLFIEVILTGFNFFPSFWLNLITYGIPLVLFDLTLYFLSNPSKKIYLLLSSLFSVLILQLIDIYHEMYSGIKFNLTIDLIMLVVAVLYMYSVILISKRYAYQSNM